MKNENRILTASRKSCALEDDRFSHSWSGQFGGTLPALGGHSTKE